MSDAISNLEEALEICADREDIDGNGNANDWMDTAQLLREAIAALKAEQAQGGEAVGKLVDVGFRQIEWYKKPPLGTKLYATPHPPRQDWMVMVPVAELEQAIRRAEVFDDGGDGADPESARSVASILTAMLTAAQQGGE